jgi:hypothetical protein
MALGATSANDCTAADLFQYLETIPPGKSPIAFQDSEETMALGFPAGRY